MVTASPPGSMQELFEGLVAGEVIDAYERLLARDGCAKDEAEAVVGGAGLVRALTDSGMAHIQPHTPAEPAWLRPASPDLALQGVLAGWHGRLARHQQLLLDGQRRLAGAQARYGVRMTGGFPEHLVAIVSDRRQISELSAALVNTARQDWMTLENLDIEMPLTDDFAQLPRPFPAGRFGAGRSTPPPRWATRSSGGSSSGAPRRGSRPGCCPWYR